MKELRFGLFGAGFWAPFHLAGWGEVDGARCAAVYNRTRAKAERLAERFAIDRVYDDPQEMLAKESLDFVDCITNVDTHARFVNLAAENGLPVICQKPLAPSLDAAREMAAACRRANVPLLVHENFRWQAPFRQLKRVLDEGAVGRVFRSRIQLGTHLLDVARFLFGEAATLYCRIHRVHPDIRGEDVATVCLDTVNSFGALEGPEAVVAALAPHVLNLHVKDFVIRRPAHQLGFVIEGCPVGRGRLDVPWLLEQLDSASRPFNAILEQWPPPTCSVPCSARTA